MIERDGLGNYVGYYTFRGDIEITRSILEKATHRMMTMLQADCLYGEIITNEYRQTHIYNAEFHARFFTFMRSEGGSPISLIRIFDIEIIEESEDIGLAITFKPHYLNAEKLEIRDFITFLENDAFTLLPRLLAKKNGDSVELFDIITFDLCPKKGTEEELLTGSHKIPNILRH